MTTQLLTHDINCPVCKSPNTVTTIKDDLLNYGQINCKKCGVIYVYKITPRYEILTATVNEFKNNQL